MMEAGMMIERFSAETGTVTWIRYVFSQGFQQKGKFSLLNSIDGR